MKIINVGASVTLSNDRDAALLREEMRARGQLMVNLMSSPGAGKTTLLSRLIKDLSGVRIAVMEADIESAVDAERIEALGARAIQVHTDGMCHMDAGMTGRSLEALDDDAADLIFLENVGNLICPAEYDTGAGLDVMILSVPEGDDKPLKYPLMYSISDVVIITKIDTKDFFDFDMELAKEHIRELNPDSKIFAVSAKTGEGLEDVAGYLREQVREMKEGKC